MWTRVGAGLRGMVRVSVGSQFGGVAEGLGAVRARVGAGGRVGPEVGCQLGTVAEGLWAVRARVRAGAAVREAVGCQLGRVGEGLGAVGARVGASATVRQPVRGQLGRVREGLVTVGAPVRALGRGSSAGSRWRLCGCSRPWSRLEGLLGRTPVASSSAFGHRLLACRTRVWGLSLRLCISLQHLAGPETFWLSLSPLTPRGPLNFFPFANCHPRCAAEAVEGREETCGLRLPGGGAAGPSRGGRGRSPAALGCDGVAPHAVHPATGGQGRERSRAAGSSLISIPSSPAGPVGASVRKRSPGWRGGGCGSGDRPAGGVGARGSLVGEQAQSCRPRTAGEGTEVCGAYGG